MIRVCPKRDAKCPHGMSCPYTIDRYSCRDEQAMTISDTPGDGDGYDARLAEIDLSCFRASRTALASAKRFKEGA